LASATLRDAPVYVSWLLGVERLLSVLSVPSVPSAGVSLPVVGVPPAEPEVPLSEPLLSGSELPAPVFLPPVWSFFVGSVSFSSPPVVSSG
jgi:hypothetical protein